MKKKRIARIVWVSSIFVELIIILVMVMDYKIHYQYLERNKLYFYDCDGTLCVTEVEDNKHLLYSSYDCEKECPAYKMELDEQYVILSTIDHNILYDYRNGQVISSNYDNYQFLSKEYIVVTLGDKQGIMNISGNVIVAPSYDKLGYVQNDYLIGYNLNYVLAKQGDKYGIISFKTGEIIEPIEQPETKVGELIDFLKQEENRTTQE